MFDFALAFVYLFFIGVLVLSLGTVLITALQERTK